MSQSVPLSRHTPIQSVTQPNPIKWLLMNFKQALSSSSTCAMLRSLLAPSMRGLTLSALLLFTLSSASLTRWSSSCCICLMVFFFFFQSLCSFVVPSHFAYFAVSLYPPLFSENMKELAKYLGKHCSLFTSFTSLLTFHFCLSVTLLFLLLAFSTSPIRPLLFIFSFLLHLFTSLLLPSSSFPLSFRHVIGALYLASYSHLNWLAVNFRPPIATWLISLSFSLSCPLFCHSFLPNYYTGRNQPYFDPSVKFFYKTKSGQQPDTQIKTANVTSYL